jgi:hypothetical protein
MHRGGFGNRESVIPGDRTESTLTLSQSHGFLIVTPHF